MDRPGRERNCVEIGDDAGEEGNAIEWEKVFIRGLQGDEVFFVPAVFEAERDLDSGLACRGVALFCDVFNAGQLCRFIGE